MQHFIQEFESIRSLPWAQQLAFFTQNYHMDHKQIGINFLLYKRDNEKWRSVMQHRGCFPRVMDEILHIYFMWIIDERNF